MGGDSDLKRATAETENGVHIMRDQVRLSRSRANMEFRNSFGGHRAGLILNSAKNSARIGGRTLLRKLPLSPASKVRLKFAILSVVGPLFGVKRGGYLGIPQDTAARLGSVKERYRELAASASRCASEIPQRSVSIVVPVYNQLAYTLRCIESIKENTSEIDHEIIVVDDCSSDATQETLSARDDVVYLRNKENLGFVGSCNAGAACATKAYLCFLNNDTTVLPYWLSALVNTFELHEHVGLAGAKLVYPDGRLQEAGGLIWSDGSAWNWGRFQHPDDSRYNYARHVDFCSGASIVVPRALFSGLGGFDDHYAPAYCEDADLAFKIRSLGLATVYQPLSRIIHFEGVTCGTDTSGGVKKHQVENLKKLAKRWAPVLTHQGRSEDSNVLCDRGVIGRILVLDQITPEPDRDAGSIASLELMRAFRELGYKITFVPCSNLSDMPPYTDLLAAVGFESVILPWTKSVREHLEERGASYDVVLVLRPQSWHDHIDDIREYAPRAKIIYYACDLHYLRHQREAEVAGRPVKTTSAELESLKNVELDLIGSADLCTLHSAVEKKFVEDERPGTRVVCFPLICEPRGKGKPMAERFGIIFVGGYGHPPNVDAVEHYVSDIHPLVKEGLSEPVMFVAAGSSPPASLLKLAGSHISVPGYVEDIEPMLSEARLMVAPLRFGAGVKGKILAAMAHGLPVVTTTIGAEGITEGEEVLVADDPKAFADAVCRLYSDTDLWHRLQSAGLAHVRRTTSREVGLDAATEMLQQLGLPFVRRRMPSDDNAAGTSTGFGSPLSVGDIGALVDVGRHMLPGAELVDIMLLPDGVAAPAQLPEHVTSVAPYRELAERLPAAETVVVVVDPSDTKSMSVLGKQLAASLPAKSSCAVVVAPPRMVGNSEGYTMVAPFADRVVHQIDVPYHETLKKYFQFEGRSCSWQIDRRLSGFPALAVLCVGS